MSSSSPVRLFAAFGALAALALGACSSSENEGAGPNGTPGPSPGGASGQQISSCKASCDKMKFFDCSSAGEQARCYADCDSAAPNQIEVFVGCAENSICDPECRTSIQPAPAPGQPAPAPAPDAVASPDSCSAACDKLIECSFLPLGAKAECAQRCATEAYQYQIDCVRNNACDRIADVCGGIDVDIDDGGDGGDGGDGDGDGGGGDVAACQAGCDKLNFFSCVDGQTFGACRGACETAEAGDRDTFSACVATAGPDCTQLQGCLVTLPAP